MIQIEDSGSGSDEFEDSDNENQAGGPRVVEKVEIEDDGDEDPLPEEYQHHHQAIHEGDEGEDEDYEYEQEGYPVEEDTDACNLEDYQDNGENDDGEDYQSVQSPEVDSQSSPRSVKDRESIEAGFKVMNRMTTNDVNTLLKRLQSELPRLDTQQHWKRQVNWGHIAFRDFTAEDCRLAWIYLKLTTRTFRNLRELVDEVALVYNNNRKRFRNKLLQVLPTYPKRHRYTGNGFLTYVHQTWETCPDEERKRAGSYCHLMKQLRPEFDQLPPAQKAIWEEFSKVEEGQRQAKIKEFYDQFPEVPMKGLVELGPRPKGLEREPDFVRALDGLTMKPRHPPFPKAEYVASKINRMEPLPTDEEMPTLRVKYSEKWKRVPNATKVKWIDLFIQKCQQLVLDNAEYRRKHPDAKVKLQLNMLRKINKQEFLMWEEYKKKPTAPPYTVRSLFRKLFSEQPQYKDLPPVEIDEKASAKFDEMSKEEQAVLRMHCVRLHEQYKREMEAYWASIPDVMKPVSLMTIPRKFRRGLTHMVEKISEYVRELDRDQLDQEGVVTSREYYEEEEADESDPEQDNVRTEPKSWSGREIEVQAMDDDDNEDEPLPKRKKVVVEEKPKRRSSGSKSLSAAGKDKEGAGREDEDDSSFEVTYEEGEENEMEPGSNVQGASTKVKSAKVVPKPTTDVDVVDQQIAESRAIQAALIKANRSNRRNVDDIVRGIFESVPALGTAFSPLYYYSKYVAQEKFWMTKVFRVGLAETADLILESFKTLSDHQKEVFVKQSLKFHQRMSKNRLEINSQRRHNKLPVRNGVYFANEPVPPPPTLERFFLQDPRENEFRPLPGWSELDLNIQTRYMKEYYARNQKYVQDYEKFVQGLNPADLLSYVFELYKGWERNHLQSNQISSRDPFAYLKTLPSLMSDLGQEQSLRERQTETQSTSADAAADLSPLNNDDYISWLSALDPPAPKDLSIPKKVTDPEPTRRQIRLQKAKAREVGEVDSDEPDSDDERIGYRRGRRVGSQRMVRRALTALERKRMQDSYEKALQKGLPGLQPAAEVEN